MRIFLQKMVENLDKIYIFYLLYCAFRVIYIHSKGNHPKEKQRYKKARNHHETD